MNTIDKIRAEIERLYDEANNYDDSRHYLGEPLSFLDTLQEPAKRRNKDCNDCKYNHLIRDQIGWQFRGCSGGDYKGKPIAEIELCPLKVAALQEPVVDFEKEIESAGKDVLRQAHKHNKRFDIPQNIFSDVQLMDIFKAGVYKGVELERESQNAK